MTSALTSREGRASGSSRSRERRRAVLRLALGTIQIFGTSASVLLLLLIGVNRWSLSAVVVTCAFTTISVLFFGDRNRRGQGQRGSGK